jgi:hypothetical protein
MDENKLSELLKDAVVETPPPSFTVTDVTRESERQRVRHRNGVLAGSAFGVALLAGATALGVALWTGPVMNSDAASAANPASGGNGNAAPYELPTEDNEAAAPTERGGTKDVPSETPKQGGYPDGSGGPAGPAGTPSGCEQVDRELAAALAGELPAAANIKVDDAIPVSLTCPRGSRGAAFDLPGGRISVVLFPASVTMATDASGVQAQAPTGDGRRVLVLSEPVSPGGTAPFGTDVQQYATDLGQLY